MGKGGWTLMQCVGLFVLVGAGQAVLRGLGDKGNELLWGMFDWVPGGFNGQMIVIGAIAVAGLMIVIWSNRGAARAKKSQ